LGSNRCPPLYNAYEAKLLNVLHSKLVKKKSLPYLLSDPLIQGLHFLKENGLIIMGDLPFFIENWSIFTGDLPTHAQTWSIFRGDLPTYSRWSIFMGDLLF
jgi:hypothetical protein